MMVFHPETTRQALPPFDVASIVPSNGAVADYCRFYHLDFENDFYGLHHSCGYVDVAGYQILTHAFIPINPKGTVWVVHGYLEHSGLYRHVLPQLFQQGYAVVIYDLPGHGLSSGTNASISNFAEYQMIFRHLLMMLRDELPKPWLGLGQSTGGAILMDYVLSASKQQQQSELERLFLLAPLVFPARMQWLQMKLAFWLFKSLRSGLPRAFRQNTSNIEFWHFMRDEDPLQARWIPLSWLLALKEWVAYMHQFPPCSFPVWVVQGGRDQTVNGTYNARFIRKNLHLVKMLILEEASHQLANERADIRAPIDHLLQQFLHE
ncbi:MAG: alpha/beta fold hydrolase [Agitococcus sp.]|nr:alpha/beta fold hydrolase [Agitococcus sp.]